MKSRAHDRTSAGGRRLPGHPSLEQWAALAERRLGLEETRGVKRHAEGCTRCAARLDAALALRAARTTGEFEAVPAAVRRLALAAFGSWRAARERARPGALGLLGRLRLLVAPGAGFTGVPAAAGVRGAIARARCELEGGDHRIDLEWTPQMRAWTLRGRVSPTGKTARTEQAIHLLLEPADGKAIRVQPNARGFFGPVRIPAPELRLTLVTPKRAFRSVWLPRRRAGR